ncbi:MAG: hypothetical protein R6U27_13150 [Desulfobacterales bacterium]
MATTSDRPKSFDTMVKYFLRYYNIPTKKDMDKLNAKMDRLETLISNSNGRKFSGGYRSRFGNTASGVVLEVIKEAGDGIRFSELQDQTGFNEKKLRNIVFRLNKLGKIRPKSRGVYIPA